MASRGWCLALGLALSLVLPVVSGCRQPVAHEVELRLLAPGIRSQDLATLRDPRLGAVLVADDEIIGYVPASHCLRVTAAARQRVMGQQVPVAGTPFALCVDGGPVLVGALWTPISSLSFDGVVIMVLNGEQGQLCLQGGYPGSFVTQGEDPRDSAKLLQAFRQAGRLP